MLSSIIVLLCPLLTSYISPVDGQVQPFDNVDSANSPKGFLSRSCMLGFGITGFRSVFDSKVKDRHWSIRCSPIGNPDGVVCKWTYDFVNNFGTDVNYRCPKDWYVSGLYSDYSEAYSDRIWRVECCKSPDVVLSPCLSSDFINKLTGDMDFHLPQGAMTKAVTGMESKLEGMDRKWKFHICDIQPTGGKPRRENQ